MENHATKKQLALARRQAASSIKWPKETSFLLNPDPSVQKKLKQMAIAIGVLAIMYAIGVAGDPDALLSAFKHGGL
ncbi:hypothetical protein LGM58_41780 [Burkholderia contaminans]|uniref:hypothetical protein n=1 Tax=Burkholderia contaminans TaxID=488447 RepID=UPI001CF0E396|nr:hypothetical protein [Burkholderia contaminans]MCA7889712.1 hypothetical protein [Burkholderia contaminans]